MRCATPSILVTQEQNQGDVFFNQHNYPEAIKHYTLMLDASKKLGIYRNLSMESDVHRKIANGYEMQGKYDLAMTHVHTAMVLDSTENNLLNRIEDDRQEGKIFIYMGSFNRSIMSLEKSLDLSEGMDQSIKSLHQLSIADTYLALGQLYAVMGRSEKSMDYTNKALTLFKQAKDQRGEMEAYLTLGSVWSDQGDILTARSIIEKSMKIAQDLKMGTARHNQLLASISTAAGDYEIALRYQEKALQEAKDFGIMGQVIWATIGMGDIYRELGDFKRAEKYYKSAHEVKDTLSMKAKSLEASLDLRMGEVLNAKEYFSSEGSVTGEGISSLRMAEILVLKEKPDSALIYLNQSLKLFSAARNRQGLSNVQLLKGRLLVDAGNMVQAKQLLDSACILVEFPETVWQSWFHLGRMYEKLNQLDKARASYLNSISVIEKIRGNLTIDEFKSTYFNSKREVYDRLINLLLMMDKSVEALQISEQARARAFYDILANKKIAFKGALPGDLILLEQEKRIEIQKLNKLLQKGDDVVSVKDEGSRQVDMRQIREALTERQSEYEDILQRIKLVNPAYTEMVAAEPVSLPVLQSKLDPKTAVLSYWISDKELIYWLITTSSITRKIVDIDRNDLATLIESTRKSIESNSQTAATAGLSQLYSILLAPVEKELASLTNLVIIPNGSLHFLPFQALINSKGEYLVQKLNFVYSPSASVYILCKDREPKAGSRFMGMALSDISVGGNIGLPGTEDELKKILPLFADNISTFGVQSTESFAKKNAGGYNFLHFATHGSYDYRQPLYSYLLFPPSDDDDGRLNVYEVFEMNINTKLVTLSACETGLGNINQGDELIGLSRAFIFAGSSSVIVSLWSVADYPTSLLMTNFYRYIKDHPLEEALTLAQRDVIKVFPQPVYWSPFILIGNGRLSAN
jgi:CHAT domain-containing protein/Tfp pilus assembly protein PilF